VRATDALSSAFGLAEKSYSFTLVCDDDVLNCMPFLFTGIFIFLLFNVFWSLNWPFCPVNKYFSKYFSGFWEHFEKLFNIP